MVGKAAFAVLGLTTLAAFSSGEEVIDDLPICVVAAEWVQDNPEALPTTLEGFADFSIPYRRAIANAMEPEVARPCGSSSLMSSVTGTSSRWTRRSW